MLCRLRTGVKSSLIPVPRPLVRSSSKGTPVLLYGPENPLGVDGGLALLAALTVKQCRHTDPLPAIRNILSWNFPFIISSPGDGKFNEEV